MPTGPEGADEGEHAMRSLLFALLGIALLGTVTPGSAKLHKKIIQFRDRADRARVVQSLKAQGWTITNDLRIINAVAAEIDTTRQRNITKAASELIRSTKTRAGVDTIKTIWVDERVRLIKPVSMTKVRTVEGEYDWGMQRIGVPQAHAQGINGEGIKIAVLDTGTKRHKDLPNLIGGQNFTTDVEDWDSVKNNDHSTHCAGIAAACGSIKGVAPSAKHWSGKVLNTRGSGQFSWVIAGMQEAVKQGAHIISMSLGGAGDSEPVKLAVQAVEDAGVFVAAAAGNSYRPPVSMPAKYVRMGACVSACGPDDKRAPFSAYGPEVSGISPGVDVLSSIGTDGHARYSGTSMATPHVAGLAALVMQKFPETRRNPALVRKKLAKTAIFLPGVTAEEQGAGLANTTAVGVHTIEPMSSR